MTSLAYSPPDPSAVGTRAHASFPEAVFGGVLGCSVFYATWHTYYSSGWAQCFQPVLASRGAAWPCLSLTLAETETPKNNIDNIDHVIDHMIDPWGQLVFLVTVLALAVWAGSVVLGFFVHRRGTSDPSIVDRLWSIVPACYMWYLYFAAARGGASDAGTQERLRLMATLVTAWACRLTWNFWRKGGYSGGEDDRWVEVQSWMTPAQFEVFNLIFVCGAQMMVLLGICTPGAAVLAAGRDGQEHPLNAIDLAAACAFSAHLMWETIADNQMFDFQTQKYARQNAGKPPATEEEADGFIQSGLWALSRHPNYYCEVTMWWCVWLFSVAATHELTWPSAIGAVWLTVLFVPPRASLDVTESISSRKYAKYAQYQDLVSRFLPLGNRYD
jgi:steroid 5-alpha reductase family enzyme